MNNPLKAQGQAPQNRKSLRIVLQPYHPHRQHQMLEGTVTIVRSMIIQRINIGSYIQRKNQRVRLWQQQPVIMNL